MSQRLPDGGFKWLNQKEIDKFDVESSGENTYCMYTFYIYYTYWGWSWLS